MGSDLFSVERVLPEQFFDGTNQEVIGERRLMLAILQDAVLCMQQKSRCSDSARNARLAVEWIRSTSDFDLYSFSSICLHLGLDEDTMRRKLLDRTPARVKNQRERRAIIVSVAWRLQEQAQ